MSDSDNTLPPKHGGRGAFAGGRKVRTGPDPEVMSNKGHPRESWSEDRKKEWRRARHADKQALNPYDEDDPPPPEHRQRDVHYERW